MPITNHVSTRLVAGLFAGALVLSACGDSDPAPIAAPAQAAADTAAPATDTAAPAAAPSAGSTVAATSGSTSLGDVLVGVDGLTLYGFTNDVDAVSTCYGTCAEAWPPLIVDADWTVAPGLDSGIFATTVREDGQLQLVAGKFPLYGFAGDTVPGDVSGQGSGDVWFAVDVDGFLIEAAADEAAAEEPAAIVSVGSTPEGDVLVDAAGLSLYGFTDDADGIPTCEGACADAWPPILLDSDELPAGLDESVFSVAQRSDGSFQLVAGKWPLYLFAGDAAPGDVNGQGSGGVWFLAAPDGSLIGAGGE